MSDEGPDLLHHEPLDPKPGCLIIRFVPCMSVDDECRFEVVYKMYDPEDKSNWQTNAAQCEVKVFAQVDTRTLDAKGTREIIIAGLQPTSTFRVKVRQTDKSADGGFSPWSDEVLYDTPVGSCGPDQGGDSDSGMTCVIN